MSSKYDGSADERQADRQRLTNRGKPHRPRDQVQNATSIGFRQCPGEVTNKRRPKDPIPDADHGSPQSSSGRRGKPFLCVQQHLGEAGRTRATLDRRARTYALASISRGLCSYSGKPERESAAFIWPDLATNGTSNDVASSIGVRQCLY
jgi:hypothetical protein